MGSDGGSAFPVLDPSSSFWREGMTLRDWFAGQALLALASSRTDNRMAFREMAGNAYRLADAMIAEREDQP
jgi:hypothetical protein